jgi:hypothetical protein
MTAGRLTHLVAHIRRTAGVPPAADPPDAELLARYVHGRDGDAFAALVRRHGPVVRGVCRRP